MDRIWIPSFGDVRTLIMDEAYTSKYSVHPCIDKMYYDLRDLYWWSGMIKDIAIYVSKCLTCSKIKVEHQRPLGLLLQPKIPEWKWEKITIDLVTKLPISSGGYDTIWVIMDRLTKYAYFLPIREDYTTEKLARIYIKEIVARHGSWDSHLPLVEFSYNNSYHASVNVGDRVLLKVSPWKGVVRFGRKGKLAHSIHDTFYVSNLKKCLSDASLQLASEEIEIDEKLHFVEEPVEIMDYKVKKLKQRRILLVKGHWSSKRGLGIATHGTPGAGSSANQSPIRADQLSKGGSI
nr:putative reverse transcriptase domain, ribonuclease H-like domain, aspartic peptidase domain protein [Tanacetum cinerariifolium]